MQSHPALAPGRVAVITGAASGIGLAAARRFASLGMKLCLADLSADALARAAAEIGAKDVLTVPTDVSKLESVQATAVIDITPWHSQKMAAFMAHTTQRDHHDRFVQLGLTPNEYFALAAGAPQRHAMITDLFEGVDGPQPSA